jgi:two-component sensor histidine kinase/tetratricopeptide (TPR) repeat protein
MRHCPRILLHLWLLLIPYSLYSQSITSSQADSLLQILAQSKPDTNRVKLYLQLGEYYVYKPGELQVDMDAAFAYATQAEDLSRTLAFATGHDGSQKVLGEVFFESKRMSELNVLLEKMKPNKNKAELLRRVGLYYVRKPHELPADLDSAAYYTQAALSVNMKLQDGTGQAKSLILLAEIYKERGDLHLVKTYQQKAIPVIEEVEDLDMQAYLWGYLGSSYTRSPESMPDNILHFEKARNLYRQLGNKEMEVLCLRIIAETRLNQGDYGQSLRELLEVVSIQQSSGLKKMHDTYDLLGHVYTRMGNYELALPYALDAIQNAKAINDTANIVMYYRRVGQIYKDLSQHDQSLKIYQTILSKLSREPDNGYFPYRLSYIREMNSSLIALKRPQEGLTLVRNFLKDNPPNVSFESTLAAICLGEAYMGLQDYTQAEKYLAEGVAKAKSAKGSEDSRTWVDWDSFILACNSNLTNLYLLTGQLQKASHHIQDNFALLQKQPDLLRLSNFYLQAFKLDSVQGKLSSAIAHYQQYKRLQDSVFNERKSNQLIAYQVQHETEAKEQDLKLKEQSIKTLTQEKHLQQEKIEKEKLIRNGIIGGAILLLLLLGVIYNRYRLKQKSNRLLEDQQSKLRAQHQELHSQQATLQEQQQQINQKNQALEQLLTEKERLLQEIHHRVKNNLQIVMSLLNSQVASLKDKVALSAIQDSQNRVQAMALIHQKLYQTEGVARIPMKSYIEELVDYLRYSFADSRRVDFNLIIGQIEFDVNMAVCLGLIINEAITNAFKYAFPGERSGSIHVGLVQISDTSYELTIEDDGVGLPASFDPSQSRSLGMTLMHGFSAQLGAELSIEGANGVKISLTLTDEKSTPIYNKAGYDN